MTPPGVTQDEETKEALMWSLGLGELNDPYSGSSGISAMAMSAGGEHLVVGLNNGGVLFLDPSKEPADGRVVDAAFYGDGGAVRSISLDRDGDRAAFVYESGYIAVIDIGQKTPLLTRHADPSATDPTIRARAAAALTLDGAFLIVTDDQVHVYHVEGGPGGHSFIEVGTSPEQIGPFLYIHPVYRAFGGLSKDGLVAIYTFTTDKLTLQGTPSQIPIGTSGDITSLSASGDGSRFAVTHSGGLVRRYQPSLIPGQETLVLDMEEKVIGAPKGVALNQNGVRLVAWSDREAMWMEGRNKNVPEDEIRAAQAATVKLRPPVPGQRFAEVDTSSDLLRLLARFNGDGAETRLYNMPEQEFFTVADVATTLDSSLVDAAGERVFQAHGQTLDAYRITERQLPPPEQKSETSTTSTAPGNADDPTGGDDEGFALGANTLLLAGGGVALLLLVVLITALLFTLRGRAPPAPLPALDPKAEEAAAPLAMTVLRGAAAPPRVRTMPVSAPSTTTFPDGLLVLQHLAVHGTPPLVGLDASWKRPGVVRIYGAQAYLGTLRQGLTGMHPVSGLLSAGGASAEETSILFTRRVQVGLLAADPSQDPETLYRTIAARHGHPPSLIERQIERDLGWLGPRLRRPLGTLRPLDQWKVRFALTLVHRPNVVLLSAAESQPTARFSLEREAADIVGQVLRGVARQYQTLVVILDDGSGPEARTLRRWCDEELHLAPNGFRDRRLLEEGAPVAPPAAGPRRRRARPGP